MKNYEIARLILDLGIKYNMTGVLSVKERLLNKISELKTQEIDVLEKVVGKLVDHITEN